MELKTKQRLTGIIMLLLLLVIFGPLLFTKQLPKYNMSYNKQETTISTVTPPPTLTIKNEVNNNQQLFTIQLASFSNKTNATKLQNKLSTNGFNCYIKEAPQQKATIYKVMIGHGLSMNNATKTLATLTKNYKLTGIITEYKT